MVISAGGPRRDRPKALTIEQENRQVREANRRLKREREILKKAAAFFASQTP